MAYSNESDSLILDKLDEAEVTILELERLRSSAEWRPTVHGLFRQIHNLKSTLAISGYESASGLIHEFESRLDALRSGKRQPDEAWTNAMIQAVDAARRLVDAKDADAEAAVEAARAALAALAASPTEAAPGASEPGEPEPAAGAAVPQSAAPGLSFPLTEAEAHALCAALGEGKRPYVLEKLVDDSLDQAAAAGLPVFDTIRSFGAPLAWRLQGSGSAGKLLSILFATAEQDSELPYLVFDPFYPIDVASCRDEARVPRILIVDDDSIALLILQYYLAPFGRVDTAVNGKDAVDRFSSSLENDPYDVVYLDLMMPGMDGHQALKAIRDAEAAAGKQVGEGCKVAISSALSDFKSISESFRGLCDAYLVKPYQWTTVDETMRKFGFSRIPVDPMNVPGK